MPGPGRAATQHLTLAATAPRTARPRPATRTANPSPLRRRQTQTGNLMHLVAIGGSDAGIWPH
jgi:hypothetical protein